MDKHSGWIIWLTGLPASGKTTIGRIIKHKLNQRGIAVILLDSDELRPLLLAGAAYNPADRDQFYARLVDFATWLARGGEHVLIAATANKHDYRSAARARVADFAEVWVRCPAEICRARDPKGLYAQAAAGAIANLPGSHAAYEPPVAPEVIVDTDRQTAEQAAETVLASIPFLSDKAISAPW